MQRLAEMTSAEVGRFLEGAKTAVLLPVGSVEPHGPHLPLGTDTLISERATERAAELLRAAGVGVVVAPSVAFGVTDFAAGFPGAIGVNAPVLTAFLHAICKQFVKAGFGHVCLVNNHLEPAHDTAVRKAIVGFAEGAASVACPLTKRWGRTLTDEYKRGNCHAGRYETSLVLAAAGRVDEEIAATLPAIATSLAEGIENGKKTFAEMGLERAYTGAPAEASREEGLATYEKLARMIATEVEEGLARKNA